MQTLSCGRTRLSVYDVPVPDPVTGRWKQPRPEHADGLATPRTRSMRKITFRRLRKSMRQVPQQHRHIQRCLVLPHNEFWSFGDRPSPLTFHNVINHGNRAEGAREALWPTVVSVSLVNVASCRPATLIREMYALMFIVSGVCSSFKGKALGPQNQEHCC